MNRTGILGLLLSLAAWVITYRWLKRKPLRLPALRDDPFDRIAVDSIRDPIIKAAFFEGG